MLSLEVESAPDGTVNDLVNDDLPDVDACEVEPAAKDEPAENNGGLDPFSDELIFLYLATSPIYYHCVVS